MADRLNRLCVFCGSSRGDNPAFAEAAREFGALLAKERIGLVYGGGGTGLMGVVADGVLEGGGRAIGIIPHALATLEKAHPRLSEMLIVDTMHERKARMADLADGFVALPGGIGTFEEILEIITWAVLGIHDKPCGVLNVAGYYDGLIAFLDHAVSQGLFSPTHRALILTSHDGPDMLAKMRYVPPDLPKWVTRSER